MYVPRVMELLRPSSGVCGLFVRASEDESINFIPCTLSPTCCPGALLRLHSSIFHCKVYTVLRSIDRMYAHLELDLSLSLSLSLCPFLVVVLFRTSRTKYLRLQYFTWVMGRGAVNESVV